MDREERILGAMWTNRERRIYTIIRNVILVWVTAVIVAGFLVSIPKIRILEHTARNLYFHVPMWFTMLAAIMISAYNSIRFLLSDDPVRDIRAAAAARLALFFGLLGLVTGIFWSRYTWYVSADIWWNYDPRQSLVVVELAIYAAYFILRGSIADPRKRGRLSAVYNIFATVTAPFLMYVLPRQMESLHPGAEGNPAFSDITHPAMRLVFYPAIIGFIGFMWILYTRQFRADLADEVLKHKISGTP